MPPTRCRGGSGLPRRSDSTWCSTGDSFAGFASRFVAADFGAAELEVIADEPIKFLEVNAATVPTGVMPLQFGPVPASGIAFSSVIIEVTPDEFEIDYKPKGFGGTRFSPVFEYVEKQGIVPLALLYLTDLECGETITDPGYPVLWVSPSYCQYPAKVFGSHIKLDLQQ